METVELTIEKRIQTGKGSARKSRAKGHAPGVVYGSDITPVAISFEPSTLRTVLKSKHGKNTVIKLTGEGNGMLVMLKELQTHPVSRIIVHSDFVHVAEDKPVVVQVPLHLEGRPEGVVAGGTLQQIERSLKVRCLAKDIPVDVRVDVTHMKIGDVLHVRDIKFAEGVSAVAAGSATLARVNN